MEAVPAEFVEVSDYGFIKRKKEHQVEACTATLLKTRKRLFPLLAVSHIYGFAVYATATGASDIKFPIQRPGFEFCPSTSVVTKEHTVSHNFSFPITGLALNADNSFLAVLTEEKICLYDVRNLKIVRSFVVDEGSNFKARR